MIPIDLLANSAKKYGDKVAISYAGRSFTYSVLYHRVLLLAEAMQDKAHVRPGDHVVLWLQNCNEFIEIVFAAFSIGAIPEFCNVRWSSEVFDAIMHRSNAKLIFAHAANIQASNVRNTNNDRLPIISVGDASENVQTYDDFISGATEINGFEKMNNDDIALQLYTSGTTNVPKGVMLTCDNIMSHVLTSAMEERWSHDDVCLTLFPLCHVAGFSAFKAIFHGATLVFSSSTKADELVRLILENKITRTSLPPVLLMRLLDYIEAHNVSIKTLRLVTYGSARMSPDLLIRAGKTIGCSFAQGYGATETSGNITLLSPENHRECRLLDTVGKPVLGTEIRIMDDGGHECQPGQIGEVITRSRTVMKGYWKQERKTEETLRNGWYHTNDMGFLDDEGFLHLKGRKDGMIISGGENIFPQEISECIASMGSDIDSAEVIGVCDNIWGQCPSAFVVKAKESTLDEQAIIEFCAERLGRYKKPKYVHFLEELPRGATGKIDGKELHLMHERAVENK